MSCVNHLSCLWPTSFIFTYFPRHTSLITYSLTCLLTNLLFYLLSSFLPYFRTYLFTYSLTYMTHLLYSMACVHHLSCLWPTSFIFTYFPRHTSLITFSLTCLITYLLFYLLFLLSSLLPYLLIHLLTYLHDLFTLFHVMC